MPALSTRIFNSTDSSSSLTIFLYSEIRLLTWFMSTFLRLVPLLGFGLVDFELDLELDFELDLELDFELDLDLGFFLGVVLLKYFIIH